MNDVSPGYWPATPNILADTDLPQIVARASARRCASNSIQIPLAHNDAIVPRMLKAPAHAFLSKISSKRAFAGSCRQSCASTCKPRVDVVLSSGFLAFGSHCGFLQAVEDAGLEVRGVMGTSSGALVGSLFAAGFSPKEILDEFACLAPIERIQFSKEPWRGVFDLSPAIRRLRELVPERFEDLGIDFGVGVVSSKGKSYDIIHSGSLAEAVVASAAVPVLFNPVSIPGKAEEFIDGGIRARVGLEAWRSMERQHNPAVVHVVGRSSPFSGSSAVGAGNADVLAGDVVVVRSSRSKSSLWNLDKAKLRKHFDVSYNSAQREISDSYGKLIT
jgi:predicted acylesterase/phospholipase RssA